MPLDNRFIGWLMTVIFLCLLVQLSIRSTVAGQSNSVRAPSDQFKQYSYDDRNSDIVLDQNTAWNVKANQINDAVISFEGPPFTHEDQSSYRRPTRLEISKASGSGKWSVINSEDTSSGTKPATVKVRKQGKGGGRATFNIRVIYVDSQNDQIPPAGNFDMTVTGTISAGN